MRGSSLCFRALTVWRPFGEQGCHSAMRKTCSPKGHAQLAVVYPMAEDAAEQGSRKDLPEISKSRSASNADRLFLYERILTPMAGMRCLSSLNAQSLQSDHPA
jgi:hypothetical protein